MYGLRTCSGNLVLKACIRLMPRPSSDYFYLKVMTHWYDCSSNGKLMLLSNLNSLEQIYKDINLSTNSSSRVQISIEEEAMMRSFYHTKIRDICAALDFSLMIEHDAHVFLHRYFLKHGILEHDIKHAMLACIFLATKTQNLHLTMDSFNSKIPNTQPELIVQLEVVVLAANDFNPPQFSPIPCVYGFVFESACVLNRISGCQEHAQKSLDRLQIAFLIDEIVLIETPAHIALACVLEFDSTFDAFWDERLNKLESFEGLYQRLHSIRNKIDHYSEISPDLLRPIDRKIKSGRADNIE